MQTTKFTDAAGREWDLRLTILTANRLEKEHGVQMVGGFSGFNNIVNPIGLAGAFVTILRPQLEKAGVTEEEFLDALDGDAIARATDAFLEAVFQLQPPLKRDALRAVYQKTLEVQDIVFGQLTNLIGVVDVEAV